MNKRSFIGYAFIVLLLFLVVQFFLIFSPFIDAIVWASILCFGFYPFYTRLKNRMQKRSTFPALLMTIIVFLAVVPPLMLIVVNVATQAIDVYQRASDFVEQGKVAQFIEHARSLPIVQSIEGNVQRWEPLQEKVAEWILNGSKTIANISVSYVGTFTKNVLFFIPTSAVMFFMLFIFFKEGHRIVEYIYHMIPLDEKSRQAIFAQIDSTLSAVIRGQMLTSVTQGIVSGCIFAILGVPGSIILGIATFFTSLIPVMGTWSVWVPVVLYLLFIQSYIKAGILIVLGLGVIGVIDNIIKPLCIGEKTKLPFFLLFFGILGGMHVYGIKGIVFAPVVLSLFFAVLNIYKEKFLVDTTL